MGIIEAIKMITMEEGIEKGIERGERSKTHEIARNMLLNTNLDSSKIAFLANCSESFVEEIKGRFKKEE